MVSSLSTIVNNNRRRQGAGTRGGRGGKCTGGGISIGRDARFPGWQEAEKYVKKTSTTLYFCNRDFAEGAKKKKGPKKWNGNRILRVRKAVSWIPILTPLPTDGNRKLNLSLLMHVSSIMSTGAGYWISK